MKSFCLFIVFFYILPAQAGSPFNSHLIAQSDSAFDPFIDYGDFQDEVTEENTINFFQQGRSFSLALSGGYEAMSFNLRQIYGDAPFFGAHIGFFVDFHFAFQLSGVFPVSHYNSLYSSNFKISHLGLDFKYYWNRQYMDESEDIINPYIVFGPFWLNIDSSSVLDSSAKNNPPSSNTIPLNSNPLVQDEREALGSFNSAGVKVGIGLELALIQQSFIGFELSYLYTALQNENEDLSKLDLPPLNPAVGPKTFVQNLQFPDRPQVEGYRFYGDLVNFGVFFGLNF